MGSKDYVGAGIFIALGILIFLTTFSFPILDGGHPGPSLFPRVLATFFIFFGGIVVLQGWRSTKVKTEESPEEEGPPPNKFNPILVIILVAAFMALAPEVGFVIAGTVLLAILMLKLRVSALKSVIVSILLAALIYTVFAKGLRVPLPIGYLGW
ncbi:MAG: tripartite tricarboxylate transporter TctB family protein [Deltaproteobacteria bacterium]|nr:MAG: tripartite tricarboxylate transporter TctB family protein [Deltaproteobacteria bacterium]